ncbi:PH domain-containing protein [Yinghuangia seranimata]|uniref:PH domain-containing protein n=1 Tax=Yinghuangia seranimata TaxID=408067 RepID=UPI00248D2128|nr:PH domain-containing protein [Yinghuangia seranimata]MDI2130969.1 PH domain-containing protein [Yinghuangia seranimata]
MKRDEGVTVYRSKPAVFTGVILLAVGGWLALDGALRGTTRSAVTVLGVVLVLGSVVVALTLRAAVFAGPERLVIRNPFRTIEIPWNRVEDVRAEYSVEVRTGPDTKFHIWSIPVSLRERKRAMRVNARNTAEDPFNRLGHQHVPQAAMADHAVADLRGMAEQFGKDSTGDVVVRWFVPLFVVMAVGAALVVAAQTAL